MKICKKKLTIPIGIAILVVAFPVIGMMVTGFPKEGFHYLQFLGQILTAIGALIAAGLVYKGVQEQIQADKDKLQRDLAEKRRSDLGARTSTALEHLADPRSALQHSGIIELATLIDEWWFFQQQFGIKDNPDEEKGLHARRQQLCDLIFTTQFPQSPAIEELLPDEISITLRDKNDDRDTYEWKTIQRLKSRLVSDNFGKNNAWSGLSLANADLRLARIEGALLQNVDMRGIHLDGSHINSSNFSGADLSHYSHLSRVSVYNSDWHGAKLPNAALTGARFVHTDLHGADLQLAGLQLAGPQLADLRRRPPDKKNNETACLHDCNLEGANFYCVDLCGASLAGSTYATGNFKYAYYDGNTIFQNGKKALEGGSPISPDMTMTTHTEWLYPEDDK